MHALAEKRYGPVLEVLNPSNAKPNNVCALLPRAIFFVYICEACVRVVSYPAPFFFVYTCEVCVRVRLLPLDIYIYIRERSIYIYIYISVCVCVCVCVYAMLCV